MQNSQFGSSGDELPSPEQEANLTGVGCEMPNGCAKGAMAQAASEARVVSTVQVTGAAAPAASVRAAAEVGVLASSCCSWRTVCEKRTSLPDVAVSQMRRPHFQAESTDLNH
jgi:hypothetical protein